MAAGRNATIYDVAKEAGVSIATVSRVIGGKTRVNPPTLEKVRAAIQKCNYRPSAIARDFNRKVSHTLAMVLPELTNPYYAQIYSAAHERAAAAGYVLMLFPMPSGNTIDETLLELLIERRIDGAILNGEYMTHRNTDRQLALIKQLKEFMPVIMLGSAPSDYPYGSVVTDLYGCAYQAVEALHALGHSRIAFLGAIETDVPNSRERGYREALGKCGIPYKANYCVKCEPDVKSGETAMHELLRSLTFADYPTAVLAINDPVALGAMKALESHALGVPSDVSVIGCDDQFYTAYAKPALSSLDTQPQKTGSTAIDMLLKNSDEHITIGAKLVLRASVSAARD
ncbi:MAG: LacI family DNA-binding transcriptional regulator [Eubacteriales bacterium]|nr:LacI family DNA-binding transcriptional regulator [Eubacteriales bacterium]MDD3882863.1 LacI family DNA-binding transcriptional regulator [Eubacteriales bacterium]MDD4512101.1 LacI family DNA-binding transcriptional regulator [Eubacteriales bacterium]